MSIWLRDSFRDARKTLAGTAFSTIPSSKEPHRMHWLLLKIDPSIAKHPQSFFLIQNRINPHSHVWLDWNGGAARKQQNKIQQVMWLESLPNKQKREHQRYSYSWVYMWWSYKHIVQFATVSLPLVSMLNTKPSPIVRERVEYSRSHTRLHNWILVLPPKKELAHSCYSSCCCFCNQHEIV